MASSLGFTAKNSLFRRSSLQLATYLRIFYLKIESYYYETLKSIFMAETAT